MLLTRFRPGEAATIVVADFDLEGCGMKPGDTKNRRDHTLLLSYQALENRGAARTRGKGKSPVFGTMDARKTPAAIGAAAVVADITPHKLRHVRIGRRGAGGRVHP